MTQILNSFEGGTSGTTITTGNTGGTSGTAFNSVQSIPAGGVFAFDNTHAAHGSLALKLSIGATSGSTYAAFTTNFGTKSDFYYRLYLWVDAAPSSSAALFRVVNGTTTAFTLRHKTDGKIGLQNAAGTEILVSTSAIPTGQWIRIEGHVTMSTTVGFAELKIFHTKDSTTATFNSSVSSQNFGFATADGYRFGMLSSQASYGPIWFDDIGLDDTAYIGPAGAANVPPTVTVTVPSTGTIGSTSSCSASASDSDGTISSYAWTVTSAPSGSTGSFSAASSSTTNFTPDLRGTYVLRCTVTDNGGATAYDEKSMFVGASSPLVNNFEGGTSGTTVSISNSGGSSGDAFDSVSSLPTGATFAYDTAHAAHGSKALKVATDTTAGTIFAAYQNLGWSDFYFRFNVYITASPSVSATLFRVMNGTTACLALGFNTDGRLRIQDSAGTQILLITSALPTNQWVRVEGHITMSATVGQVELKTYNSADSSTATYSSQTTAAQNFFASTATDVRLGMQSSNASFGPFWLDDFKLSTSAYPGPAGTNADPTVTVTAPSTRTVGQVATCTASAADSDGTISGYLWTLTVPGGSSTSLSSTTSNSTTFTPDKPGNYVVTCTVTDNLGATAADTKTTVVGAISPLSNNFEGIANGTTITVANSGPGGNSFDVVSSVLADGTFAVDNTHAGHGSVAVKIQTTATAGSQSFGWNTSFGQRTDFYVRFNLWLDGSPPTSVTIWRALNGTTASVSLSLGTDRTLRVQDATGNVILGLLVPALPTGQWVRVEMHIQMSSTRGFVEVKTYNAYDSVVPTYQGTSDPDDSVIFHDYADGYRLGLLSSQTYFGPAWYDDYTVSTSGYPGPAGSTTNTLPTVSVAGPSSSPWGDSISATATAIDLDGTIASYAWTVQTRPSGSTVALAGATTVTASLFPDKVGTWVIRCTVTDNQGGTAYAEFTMVVAAPFYIFDGTTWLPGYDQIVLA